MDAPKPKDKIELIAGHLVSGWIAGKGRIGQSSCPDLAEIEAPVTSNWDVSAQELFDTHILQCSTCRRLAAMLQLMESVKGERTTWRLRYIRELAAEGSRSALQCASRVAAFLRSVSTRGSVRVPQQLQVVGEVRAASMVLQTGLSIVAEGRMVVQAELDVKGPVLLSFDLEESDRRLEVFKCNVSGGRVNAIVDLSCCVSEPMSIDLRAPRVLLRNVEPEIGASGAQLPSKVSGRSLDLNVIDNFLGGVYSADSALKSVSEEFLESGYQNLADYINAWSAGNYGEIPETAFGRYAALHLELARRIEARESMSMTADEAVRWQMSGKLSEVRDVREDLA